MLSQQIAPLHRCRRRPSPAGGLQVSGQVRGSRQRCHAGPAVVWHRPWPSARLCEPANCSIICHDPLHRTAYQPSHRWSCPWSAHLFLILTVTFKVAPYRLLLCTAWPLSSQHAQLRSCVPIVGTGLLSDYILHFFLSLQSMHLFDCCRAGTLL